MLGKIDITCLTSYNVSCFVQMKYLTVFETKNLNIVIIFTSVIEINIKIKGVVNI